MDDCLVIAHSYWGVREIIHFLNTNKQLYFSGKLIVLSQLGSFIYLQSCFVQILAVLFLNVSLWSGSLQSGRPVASFKQHSAPITSVEWNPVDSSVFAAAGADDVVSQWDLSVESSDVGARAEGLKDLPPQLLFLHQGQSEVKEIHWHPQLPGVMVSTALSGFNVFRTISV